ncbi:3'-5' exonuclease [Rhodococcus hoagii]|nr:3'-5' exonuclease [Prescottella equi]MBM4574706.1 3'-5' exonuclease [Prescottella equi]MBM4574910.1 3'-5' exonuclease [Prescottella equi]MBM4654154.1 3'-5' exonuclease [Prescottella equi]MBM4719627.1 3'-5' exonuclease [Prescottella equi]
MNATPGAVEAARRLLATGHSCILDCESTGLDGSIVEIAVIAADTGAVLFDELVNPDGVGIEAEARAVHGISDKDLAGARTWPQVFPDLVDAIGSRRILAYSAKFDRARIIHDCKRFGIDAATVANEARWGCLMELRSDAHGSDTRLRLDGGHRALGDVLAAREVLRSIADGVAA